MTHPALFFAGFLFAGLLVLVGVPVDAVVAGGIVSLLTQGVFALGRRAGLAERE